MAAIKAERRGREHVTTEGGVPEFGEQGTKGPHLTPNLCAGAGLKDGHEPPLLWAQNTSRRFPRLERLRRQHLSSARLLPELDFVREATVEKRVLARKRDEDWPSDLTQVPFLPETS